MLESLTLRTPPVVSPLSASLEAFLLSREAMRCTPKTLVHYRYTAGGFVSYLQAEGVRDVRGITPGHIRAYLVSLERRGVKDTTQHAHARGVKTWLTWLVDEGDLPVSPMSRVSMPRLEQRIPAPFSPEDVRKLLAGCERNTATGMRNYALMLTLLDSGLRASEAMGLRLGNVDMRSGLVTVMGKGRKMRQVRIGAKARAAIVKMMGYRPDAQNGDALWAAYDGLTGAEDGALTLAGLQVMLWRLGRRVGVTPCGAHRFRRTFALWCLRDGMDLHSLRLLMGHSDLTVLQRYLALAGEDIERAHAAHSPADRLLG